MEPSKLAKQTIEFYKNTFDNTFNALLMLQEQTQKMLKMQLDQMAGFPDEGKKVVNEWIKAYKKGCDEFKSAADDSFRKVEEYFSGAAKTDKK